eukprot:13076371-Heterocapsa_arctica.AAC.1
MPVLDHPDADHCNGFTRDARAFAEAVQLAPRLQRSHGRRHAVPVVLEDVHETEKRAGTARVRLLADVAHALQVAVERDVPIVEREELDLRALAVDQETPHSLLVVPVRLVVHRMYDQP